MRSKLSAVEAELGVSRAARAIARIDPAKYRDVGDILESDEFQQWYSKEASESLKVLGASTDAKDNAMVIDAYREAKGKTVAGEDAAKAQRDAALQKAREEREAQSRLNMATMRSKPGAVPVNTPPSPAQERDAMHTLLVKMEKQGGKRV